MDRTTERLTSVDCIRKWIVFKLRMGAETVSSHQIQAAGPWIKTHLDLQFNPETLSRAWRHARTRGHVGTVQVGVGVEDVWKILSVDGIDAADVRKSDFPQDELFDESKGD